MVIVRGDNWGDVMALCKIWMEDDGLFVKKDMDGEEFMNFRLDWLLQLITKLSCFALSPAGGMKISRLSYVVLSMLF